MRKGLVITLGVVALTFAVSQGFALAPVISTIPDVIISDFEQNVGQTVDQNFFVFSNALNLDDLVRDDDTSKSALRWSFVETGSNPWVRINGKSGVPVTGVRDPGTSNIRTTNWASFRNNRWSPITGQPPYPAPTPPGTSLSTTIQMAVSDAVNVTSQAILVTAVDTTIPQNPNMQKDALTPKPIGSWPFTTNTGANAWTWYDTGGALSAPTHASPAGQLEMTKAAGQALPVYGSWESPKDPSLAVKARWGAVLRARFRMRGSVDGAASPSFRFRAIWTRVMQSGASWIPEFQNQDFNDDLYVWYQTLAAPLGVAGREPGIAGKTYTVLYYPQQTDTLMTTSAIVYFGCDLLDADSFMGANDAGTLILDQVDVDSFARPSLGAPNMTSVPQLTYTTAGNWGWTYGRQVIGGAPPNSTGLTTSVVTGIRVTTVRGNSMQEISFVSPGGTALESGKYYRALYRAGSNMTPGGDFPPETRFGVVSSRLVFIADKHLKGGGLYSNLKSAGSDAELWVCAPSQTGTTQTENMSLRFEALILLPTDALFGNKNISGAVWINSVRTEKMTNVP